MAALSDEHQQFELASGVPNVNGYIYIGQRNQDPVLNPITIYSDRGLTTPIDNPQRTDAKGRSVNKIWVADRYSIKVTDEDGGQEYQELDAGETPASGITSLSNVQGINSITAEASPAIDVYADKEIYIFRAVSAITGAVTLDAGAGAKAIKKLHDQALVQGDIEANQIVLVAYNETDDVFEMPSISTDYLSDVLTTRGDLLRRGATGEERMAKGTEGKIIRYGANDPAADDAIPQSEVVTPTSGTSVAITSIPAWVVRITLTFNELISSGSNEINIQIGDSGGLETTGYDALRIRLAADGSNVTSTHTTEFPLRDNSSASVSGVATLELHDPAANLWHYIFKGDRAGTNGFFHSGYKALSATLDRLSVLTTSTDTFVGNTGTVGIKWE